MLVQIMAIRRNVIILTNADLLPNEPCEEIFLKSKQNGKHVIGENEFENVVCKMIMTGPLLQPHWFKFRKGEKSLSWSFRIILKKR